VEAGGTDGDIRGGATSYLRSPNRRPIFLLSCCAQPRVARCERREAQANQDQALGDAARRRVRYRDRIGARAGRAASRPQADRARTNGVIAEQETAAS
jgi:hypothetical protein